MSSWFNPKTEKRTSQLHGRGLFAREPISAGEIVAATLRQATSIPPLVRID